MFAHSDPTGTGFLQQSGALDNYRRMVGQVEAGFHRRPNSAFTMRKAFAELEPGGVAETTTVDWKAFPVSQPGTPAQIDDDRFNRQDEYVEWRVEKTGGSLTRVTFTTEFTEYFEAVAEVGADALKSEIARIHPGAVPTDAEIFGAGFDPATATVDARRGAFIANLLRNPWNNGERGILCLTQGQNTLGALYNLLASCGQPRPDLDPGDVCGAVGGACGSGRNSDPAVCRAAQGLARDDKSFSLEDPCGIRILGLDPTGQWTVAGQAVNMNDEANNRGIWKISRNGRRGTFTFSGNVRLGGNPITTGTQLSRQLSVGATVVHALNADLPEWARRGRENLRVPTS